MKLTKLALLLLAGADGLRLCPRPPVPRSQASPTRARVLLAEVVSAVEAGANTTAVAANATANEPVVVPERGTVDEWEYYSKKAQAEETNFMSYVWAEKARKEWEKDNPVNIGEKMQRTLSGPASTLLLILGGFYAIPVVRGLSAKIQEGDVAQLAGKVADSVGAVADSVTGGS